MSDEPTSFKIIFLSKWMPTILAALIGGPIVAVAAPWLQTRFLEETTLANRKIDLWESVGRDFTLYIDYRGRLNDAARWQQENTFTNEEQQRGFRSRKEEYRRGRDESADALNKDFVLAGFYYSATVADLIKSFQKWHYQYRIATVDELPDDETYLKWRDRIMLAMKEELG